MLIPLGHEQTSVRRLPWVSISIVILCVLAYVWTLSASPGNPQEHLDTVAHYYLDHPYLKLDERLKPILFQGRTRTEQDAFVEAGKEMGKRPDDPAELAVEQRRLDDLTLKFFDSLVPKPYRDFGLNPTHIRPFAFITYQFMHGGLLHLLGNLFFLYLAGPFIEDVWGRPLYAGFYLLAGVVAAAMFVLHYPHLDTVLIGASGAIAGLMGAFLVRYWNIKIKFFYWFGLVFRGTFSAPAWLMLPLWFLNELLWASGTDAAHPEAGGSGVAYWAHVWGFAFGVAVALGMKYLKVEERFLHPAIESKITLVANPAVEEAAALREQGKGAEALALLREETQRNPDAAAMYWSVAVQERCAAEAVPTAERLVRDALRGGEVTNATAIWRELRQHAPGVAVDPVLAARMAETFAQEGARDDAADAVEAALAEAGPATPAAVLLRLARVAVGVGSPLAAEVVTAAREHPELPPESLRDLDELAAGLAVPPPRVAPQAEPPAPPAPPAAPAVPEEPQAERVQAATSAATETPAAAQGPEEAEEEPDFVPVIEAHAVTHTVSAVAAVPTGMTSEDLKLRVGSDVRSLPFEKVAAVAVAGIQGTPPYLLVDLLLDGPWSDRKALRSVRLNSTTFDPRPLVAESGSTIEAFRALLDLIVNTSGAVPLPDPDAALGRPFKMFGSEAEYEREVLGAEPEAPASP